MDDRIQSKCCRLLKEFNTAELNKLNSMQFQERLHQIESLLRGTELQDEASFRIRNAFRFVESEEIGAAIFEIKSLVNGLEKRVQQF